MIADVIATVVDGMTTFVKMADVIAIVADCEMADSIAIVADGITTQIRMLLRQILLPLWQME